MTHQPITLEETPTGKITERASVLNLDQERFDGVCAALMHKADRDGRPDVLIAIPTGGLFVARSMAAAIDGGIPVLTVTCRRPSSRLKLASSAVRKIVGGLPRPIADSLRVVEHAVLTRRPSTTPSTPYRFVQQELDSLDTWMSSAARPPSILIVDDAVDSGATLSQVIDIVRRRSPPGATIRSSVITVTTDRPLVRPDYAMFDRQLCRFPWSLDARRP